MEALALCDSTNSCCAVMNDIGTAPLQVVGYEGIFGCLAMFCVLLPIVQHTPGQDGSGLHEDSWETWHVGLRTVCHSFKTLRAGTHQTSWLESTGVCPCWTHAGCPCLVLRQLHMLHEPASSLLLLLPGIFAGCTCHSADSNKLGKASLHSIM